VPAALQLRALGRHSGRQFALAAAKQGNRRQAMQNEVADKLTTAVILPKIEQKFRYYTKVFIVIPNFKLSL